MSDVCRHGWTKINYNACPRCRDDARHAEEVARLTAALASSQAEVEEVKGRLAFALESAMEWQTQALGAISERDAALQRAEGWEEEARTYAQNATFQREQRESAESRAADLDRWQREVAEGLGFLNQPDGQSGYEVADPATIIEAWRTLQREAEEAADLAKRLEEGVELVEDLAAQYGCDCGHPACKRCQRTRAARAWLDSERAKG